MPNQLVNFFRATRPDQAAGLSDDDITLKYAEAAPQFLQRGQNLAELYPDWAAEAEAVSKSRAAATIPTSAYARQALGSMASGAISTVGAIPKTAAAMVELGTGGYFDPTQEVGAGVESVSQAPKPSLEELTPDQRGIVRESFWASKAPEAVGSVGGLVGLGLAGRVASGITGAGRVSSGIKAATSVPATGFSMGFSQGYDDAIRKGADPNTAFQSGLLNGGVGLSEAIPAAKFLDRISRVSPSARFSIPKLFTEAGEEAGQELGQSAAADAIAKEIVAYDPDLEVLSSAASDAAAGGVAGFLFSALTQALSRRAAKPAAAPEEENLSKKGQQRLAEITKLSRPEGPPAPGTFIGPRRPAAPPATPPPGAPPAPATTPPPGTPPPLIQPGEEVAEPTGLTGVSGTVTPPPAQDVAEVIYGVNAVAVDQLIQRTLQGDNTEVEVADLKPEELTLFNSKLEEARPTQVVSQENALIIGNDLAGRITDPVKAETLQKAVAGNDANTIAKMLGLRIDPEARGMPARFSHLTPVEDRMGLTQEDLESGLRQFVPGETGAEGGLVETLSGTPVDLFTARNRLEKERIAELSTLDDETIYQLARSESDRRPNTQHAAMLLQLVRRRNADAIRRVLQASPVQPLAAAAAEPAAEPGLVVPGVSGTPTTTAVAAPLTAIQKEGTLPGDATRDQNIVQAGTQTQRGVSAQAGGDIASQISPGITKATDAWLEGISGNDPEASRNAAQAMLGESPEARGILAGAYGEGAALRAPGGYGTALGETTAEQGARPPQERGLVGQPAGESGVDVTLGPQSAARSISEARNQIENAGGSPAAIMAMVEAARFLSGLSQEQQQARSARALRVMLQSQIPGLSPEETSLVRRAIYASIYQQVAGQIPFRQGAQAGGEVVQEVRGAEVPAEVGGQVPGARQAEEAVAKRKAELSQVGTPELRRLLSEGANIEDDEPIRQVLADRGEGKPPIDWKPEKGAIIDVGDKQAVRFVSRKGDTVTYLNADGTEGTDNISAVFMSAAKEPAKAPPAAAPVAPAPADKVADERIAKAQAIQSGAVAFAAENTGDDSREFIASQEKVIEDQINNYAAALRILGGAQERRQIELETNRLNNVTKDVPLLNDEEQRALKLSHSESIERNVNLKALAEQAKAGQISEDTIKGMIRVLGNLQQGADNRLRKLREKSGGIKADGKEKLTAEQLLNPESVLYGPQTGTRGYIEVGDASPEGKAVAAGVSAFDAAKDDEAREKAAFKIGDNLSVGSRVRGGRRESKRQVAWLAPDGSVVVTTAVDNSGKRGGVTPKSDKAWRYTIGKYDAGKAKQQKIEGGNAGVLTMLSAGYRPIASIATMTPRGRVTLVFPNLKAFNDTLGDQMRMLQESTLAYAESAAPVSPRGEAVTQPEGAAITGRVAEQMAAVGDIAAKDTMGKVAPAEPGEEAATTEDEGGIQGMMVRIIELFDETPELVKEIDDYYKANPDAKISDITNKFGPAILTRHQEIAGPVNSMANMIDAIEVLFERFKDKPEALKLLTKGTANEFDTRAEEEVRGVTAKEPGVGRQDAPVPGGGGGVAAEGTAEEGGAGAGASQAATGGQALGGTDADGNPVGPAVLDDRPQTMLEWRNAAARKVQNLVINKELTRSEGDYFEDAIAEADTAVEIELALTAALAAAQDKIHKAKAVEDGPEDAEGGDPDLESPAQEGVHFLLPDSAQNAEYNLHAVAKTPKGLLAKKGILGVMSEAKIIKRYGPDLKTALGIIQKEENLKLSGNKNPGAIAKMKGALGRTYYSILAQALGNQADLTGVSLQFVNDNDFGPKWKDPNTGKVTKKRGMGYFNYTTETITVNLAAIPDIASLHEVILHEMVHAYTSRLYKRWKTHPATLTSNQRATLQTLEALEREAKAAGLKWQQSEGAGSTPEASFLEFITAAMTDARFQVDMNRVQRKTPSSPPNDTLLQSFIRSVTELVSQIMAEVWAQVKLVTAATGRQVVIPEAIPSDETLLAGALETITSLIKSYDGMVAAQDRMYSAKLRASLSPGADSVNKADDVSYMLVEGVLKDEQDISVDTDNKDIATTKAKEMMAVTNHVDGVVNEIRRKWSKGGLVTQREFVEGPISAIIGSEVQTADEVRGAINTALTDQLASPVDVNTQIADLDRQGAGLHAARDAHTLLTRLAGAISASARAAQKAFASGTLKQKIDDSNTELAEVTKKYTDLNHTKGSLTREIRRMLREQDDTGATDMARQLGVPDAKKAVISAAGRIEGNIDANVDTLAAMSELGINFGALRKDGALSVNTVQKAIQGSTDPRLAGVKADPAELAVLTMYAKNRPMVMNLLAMLKAGELRKTLDDILKVAMSDKEDAIALASAMVPRLGTFGAIGQRLIENVREIRAENKELKAQMDFYLDVDSLRRETQDLLYQRIQSLEREIGMEGATTARQWQAVPGEEYSVPNSPTDSEADIFAKSTTNTRWKKVQAGPQFDFKQNEQDRASMRAWMKANASKAGSSNYQLMKRWEDRLAKLSADNADYYVRRGPGGWMIKVLGDIATRADYSGTDAGRRFANMVRRFAAIYDAYLKGPNQNEFRNFDKLALHAKQATGIDREDFWFRFFDTPLAFLMARKDLVDPKLSDADQLKVSLDEAMAYINSDPALTSAEAKAAVRALLEQGVKNNNLTQTNRKEMGLKVRENVGTDENPRFIFREPIGVPAHTMSRGISSFIRNLVAADMVEAGWREAINKDTPSLASVKAVAALYTVNRAELDAAVRRRFTPRIVDGFVRELVEKPGESNFWAPTINNVRNRAQPRRVLRAFHLSGGAAGHDMLKFAERLYALEGGDPTNADAKAEFVASTLATFKSYFSKLDAINQPSPHSHLDDAGIMARSFLDARQGEDFPAKWLEFRRFGEQDNVRYTRSFALQEAFGNNSDDASATLNAAKARLQQLAQEYEESQKPGLTKAERDAILNKDGLRNQRRDAKANLADMNALERDFAALVTTLNGTPQEYGLFMKILGMLSGYTVQGAMTAFTDTSSMIMTILRRFGFSTEAVELLFGNAKNFGIEAVASLMQAFGLQLHLNKQWSDQTALLNKYGAVDPDALIKERHFLAFARRYQEYIGDEETLRNIFRRAKDMPTGEAAKTMATEGTRAVVQRALAAARTGLELGFGTAKTEAGASVTFKPFAPFTWINQLMHRAVARTMLGFVNDGVRKAGDYMVKHPADAADPNFKFTSKNIQWSQRGLSGIKLSDKHWDTYTDMLARAGISLEEAGRRFARGEEALTRDQVFGVLSLAQSEVLMNTSITTRAPWTMSGTAGRLSNPIIGWSLYQIPELIKTFARDPRGQRDWNTFGQSLIAWALAILPASLAYALLRDWYEEEIVGKKQNVLSVSTRNGALDNIAAVIDSTSRLGVLGGMAGEAVNSAFNVSTAREFSVDSRVFFVSSLMNVWKTMSTLYHQGGTATYATVWRPLMQSVGGSGYLQNFDAINNTLELDNSERRMVRRINIDNQLRVVGRTMGLDVRPMMRGVMGMPSPVKPWISEMVMAAYANDAAGFRRAYTRALEAATRIAIEERTPNADPRADVAEYLTRAHPLRKVFSKSPTKAEYQKALLELGDDAAEVRRAIGNLNAYLAQIPRARGKEGIEPFTGTDRGKTLGGSSGRAYGLPGASMGVPAMPRLSYKSFTTQP